MDNNYQQPIDMSTTGNNYPTMKNMGKSTLNKVCLTSEERQCL